MMTEYQKQAQDFLAACNATMKIEFQCVDVNRNWNDNSKRNKYCFTITTPRGTMYGDFWDSVHYTKISLMKVETYFEKRYHIPWSEAHSFTVIYLPLFGSPDLTNFFGILTHGKIGICVPTRFKAGEKVGFFTLMPEALY